MVFKYSFWLFYFQELLKDESELVRRATEERWEIWGLKHGTGQIVEGLTDALKRDPRVEIVTNTPCQSVDLNSKSATVRLKRNISYSWCTI